MIDLRVRRSLARCLAALLPVNDDAVDASVYRRLYEGFVGGKEQQLEGVAGHWQAGFRATTAIDDPQGHRM